METPRYKKTPIGISFPIQRGNSGFFDQTYNSNEVAHSNIRMLLSTIVGERRFNPTYGTKLWSYLFENIDESSEEILKNILTEDIGNWIPDVSIVDIAVKMAPIQDGHAFLITLKFYSSKYSNELQTLNFQNVLRGK